METQRDFLHALAEPVLDAPARPVANGRHLSGHSERYDELICLIVDVIHKSRSSQLSMKKIIDDFVSENIGSFRDEWPELTDDLDLAEAVRSDVFSIVNDEKRHRRKTPGEAEKRRDREAWKRSVAPYERANGASFPPRFCPPKERRAAGR